LKNLETDAGGIWLPSQWRSSLRFVGWLHGKSSPVASVGGRRKKN
jgi:hypothetical protein